MRPAKDTENVLVRGHAIISSILTENCTISTKAERKCDKKNTTKHTYEPEQRKSSHDSRIKTKWMCGLDRCARQTSLKANENANNKRQTERHTKAMPREMLATEVERLKWLCANIKINSIYFYFIFHLIVHGFLFCSVGRPVGRWCYVRGLLVVQFSSHFSFGHFGVEFFAAPYFNHSLSLSIFLCRCDSHCCDYSLFQLPKMCVWERMCCGRSVIQMSIVCCFLTGRSYRFWHWERITIISYL